MSTNDNEKQLKLNRATANEKVAAQAATSVLGKKVAKEDELLKISQRNELTEPISVADKERDILERKEKAYMKNVLAALTMFVLASTGIIKGLMCMAETENSSAVP